jgi:hypothetical protein
MLMEGKQETTALHRLHKAQLANFQLKIFALRKTLQAIDYALIYERVYKPTLETFFL